MGDGFIGMRVSGLMVDTWLVMRSWPCMRRYLVLYIYTVGTCGLTLVLRCRAGGIESVSYGITWGVCWGRGLGSGDDFIDMSPGVFTLRGGAVIASGVAYGVFTFGVDTRESSCGGTVVVGGVD